MANLRVLTQQKPLGDFKFNTRWINVGFDGDRLHLVDEIVHANLRCGDVDADAQSLHLPAVQKRAPHHKIPQRIDEPAFLRDGYKYGRRNVAAFARAPARERLHADCAPVANLFLIHHAELFVQQRIAQFIAQQLLGALCFINAGIEEHQPLPAGAFGLIEREARAPHAFQGVERQIVNKINADAATVLNISEDHLDRYAGLEDYAAAKARIFKGCRRMVLNRDDDRSLGMGRCGKGLVTFGLDRAPRDTDYGLVDGWLMRGSERLLPAAEMKLAGLHNAANAMAALALLEAAGIAPQSVLPALREFRGLAHRVEFVTRRGDIDFYDDSKGTNVGATLAAINGMGNQNRKLALILGGDGKGQDFSPLAAAVATHGRAVALIGRDAGAIEEILKGCGVPLQRCADMAAAVRFCAGQAQAGDAVLLSPACASLDMYRNYAHRAEAFIAAVNTLEAAAC